jgi:hypothetical protein
MPAVSPRGFVLAMVRRQTNATLPELGRKELLRLLELPSD